MGTVKYILENIKMKDCIDEGIPTFEELCELYLNCTDLSEEECLLQQFEELTNFYEDESKPQSDQDINKRFDKLCELYLDINSSEFVCGNVSSPPMDLLSVSGSPPGDSSNSPTTPGLLSTSPAAEGSSPNLLSVSPSLFSSVSSPKGSPAEGSPNLLSVSPSLFSPVSSVCSPKGSPLTAGLRSVSPSIFDYPSTSAGSVPSTSTSTSASQPRNKPSPSTKTDGPTSSKEVKFNSVKMLAKKFAKRKSIELQKKWSSTSVAAVKSN